MATVFLNPGESWIVSNDGSSVFGNTGYEQIIINPGVTGVEPDGNVERVDLGGNVGDFTFQQQSNQLVVFSGGVAVMTLSVQGGLTHQVVFADGSRDI